MLRVVIYAHMCVNLAYFGI